MPRPRIVVECDVETYMDTLHVLADRRVANFHARTVRQTVENIYRERGSTANSRLGQLWKRRLREHPGRMTIEARAIHRDLQPFKARERESRGTDWEQFFGRWGRTARDGGGAVAITIRQVNNLIVGYALTLVVKLVMKILEYSASGLYSGVRGISQGLQRRSARDSDQLGYFHVLPPNLESRKRRRNRNPVFYARMPSGKGGLWRRVGRKRLPIEPVYTYERPSRPGNLLPIWAQTNLELAREFDRMFQREAAREVIRL